MKQKKNEHEEEARQIPDSFPTANNSQFIHSNNNKYLLTEGTILAGRYQLKRLLGEGATGQVYLCFDLMTKREYALKVIHPYLAEFTEIKQQFLHELNFSEQLNHPGIVRIYTLSEDPLRHLLFYTMEYLQGRTLEDIFESNIRVNNIPLLPIEKSITIFEQVFEILRYAHNQGVVHRDLKPSNIIILEDGTVKILDFGIAKSIQEHPTTKHTKGIGTPYYMSPEQVEGKGNVTPASDIFSLGVIMYRMLTGEFPVGQFIPPSQLLPELPKSIDKIILKAMHSRAIQRYQNIEELIDDFELFRAEQRAFPIIEKLYTFLSFSSSFELFMKLNEEEHEFHTFKNLFLENLDVIQLAATRGNVQAQYIMGFFKENEQEALEYIFQAANQGHLESQILLTINYSESDNPQEQLKSLEWLFKAIDQNSPAAQTILAYFYYEGKVVKQDFAKALQWFSAAARQGDVEAQAMLGRMYFEGEVIEKNLEQCFYWISKAAEQGHSEAQYILGVMYHKGVYVTKNKQKAVNWLEKASEKKSSSAQCLLGEMLFNGDGIHKNPQRGLQLLLQAAENDDEEAQFILGEIYYDGKEEPKDISKSIHWFSRAANNGVPLAEYILGSIYYDDEEVPRDISKAIYWFSRAANNGMKDAQFSLGLIYLTKKEGKKNFDKGVSYLKQAAQQGHLEAQRLLDDYDLF